MKKDFFVIDIPKDLDKKFRKKVEQEGKQYNLALEEAMILWIENTKKIKKKKS